MSVAREFRRAAAPAPSSRTTRDRCRPCSRAPATGRSPAPSGASDRDRCRRVVAVEHRAGRDLVPVVILGVDPEDRHHRHAVLAADTALRQPDRRERLQQRVERAAEEPGLLAGDDRHGAGIGQRRAAARAAAGASRRSCCAARTSAMPWRSCARSGRANGCGPGRGLLTDCRRRTPRGAKSKSSRSRAGASTEGGEHRRPAERAVGGRS